MHPDLRRIVAVEVHRRRAGRCPFTVYAFDAGEVFAIEPRAGGFRDLASGLAVRSEPDRILLDDGGVVELRLEGDVGFSGRDLVSGERFTGRAGGGTSVTVYDARGEQFFPYGMAGPGGELSAETLAEA